VISTFGVIVIVAFFIIEIIVNYCVLQETNVIKCMKISDLSLFLAIRFKFSITLNEVNLQRGNVIFVIYIAIEIIVIMISIIKILEIFLLSHSPTCKVCLTY